MKSDIFPLRDLLNVINTKEGCSVQHHSATTNMKDR